MDSKVLTEINRLSFHYWAKLHWEQRAYYDREDFKSDLMLFYCEIEHKVDFSLPEPKWRGYIGRSLVNRALQIVKKSYRARLDTSTVEIKLVNDILVGVEESVDVVAGEECRFVCIDTLDPLNFHVLSEEQEETMQKINIALAEISDLCERFGADYDKNKPMESLVAVLVKALNELPEKKFNKLPPEVQDRLAELGEAVSESGVGIQIRDGKVAHRGIKQRVDDLYDGGLKTGRQVMAALREEGVEFNENSVATLVSMRRRADGTAAKISPQVKGTPGWTSEVEKIFNEGLGYVRAPDIAGELDKKGLKYSINVLNQKVRELRRRYNLA